MTVGLLLLLVLGVALAVAVVALVHEWRWRGEPARPPLPGARQVRGLVAAVDASLAMHALRRIRASVLAGPREGDERSEPTDAAAGDGGPRTIRPARLVVSGSVGPPLGGARTSASRPDPRARLARDLLAVAGLGAAVVMVLVLMPPGPPAESEVLGATGVPEPRTPLPAIVTLPPWATPGTVTTSSPEPSPSAQLLASPSSPAAAPSADASATSTPSADRPTPSPTATSRPVTPRPSGTTAPSPSPSPSLSPSPDVSSVPSPSPSPEPTPSPPPSPEPTPSPSPSPETSASPSPPPSIQPSPSPGASPSPVPTAPPSPSPSSPG